MMRFDGERVHHHAWVIMPNHVHLLFTPVEEMGKLIRIWKSVSATGIGKGPIWQRNYRDSMIRDRQHFANAVRYIRRKPDQGQAPGRGIFLLGKRHGAGNYLRRVGLQPTCGASRMGKISRLKAGPP